MECAEPPTLEAAAASFALLLDAGSAQRLPMKKAKSCKVYYSILAICYLEVRAAARRGMQNAQAHNAEPSVPRRCCSGRRAC